MGNMLENWIVFYNQDRNSEIGHVLLMRRQPTYHPAGMSAVTALLCDEYCQIADISGKLGPTKLEAKGKTALNWTQNYSTSRAAVTGL